MLVVHDRRRARLAPCLALLALLIATAPARGQEEIPEDPEDPGVEFVEEQEARLNRHPFFRRVTYTAIDTHAPLRFLVQRPPRDLEGYEERQARVLAPWFAEIERSFRELYVEPLDLEPSGVLPRYTIALLATKGDYQNYADAVRSGDLYHARAHYDPELKIAVTYENTFNRSAGHLERRPALHEFVHVLQHAFHADRAGLPRVAWFNEGLAEYLSYHLGRDPSSLERRELDRGAARDFLAVASNAAFRTVYLHTAADLIGYRDYGAVLHAVRQRARASNLEFEAELALSLFYQQSFLFMHFLHQGQEGRYLEQARAFVRNVLAGEPGERAFVEAFPDVPLEQLDRELLVELHDLLHLPMPADLALATPAAAGVEPAGAEASPEVDLAALALDAEDGTARVGLAVGLALEGRTERAAEVLRAALEGPASEHERERMELELTRVEAWMELRDRYLEDLAAGGKSLDLRDWRGARLKAAVVAVENGRVLLAQNKRGVESIALSDLRPLDLAHEVGADAARFAPKWVRLYPYCATANPKWKRLLSSDTSVEVARLKNDAASFYPDALRTGGTALVLERLRERGIPGDEAGAGACLEDLRSIWPARSESPVVARRRAVLAAIATRALEIELAGRGIEELVHTRVERLGEDTVRLTYDFKSGDQALDFAVDPECLSDRRLRAGPLAFPDEAPTFRVGRGSISGHGATALRHVLEFEAPMKVTYKATWDERSGQPAQAMELVVGLCDDGFGNAVQVAGLGHLTAFDAKSNYLQQAMVSGSTVYLGNQYSLEVAHDGQVVTVQMDGAPRSRVNAGPLTKGSVFLWIHSDLDVTVRGLVIEGRVPESALAAAHAAAVQAGLESMGF